MRQHTARNDSIDPQTSLRFNDERIAPLIPNGSIGAVVVIEPSMYEPDRPRYVGFWVPRPDLTRAHFRTKLSTLVDWLRDISSTKPERKSLTSERKRPVRKPVVRKPVQRRDDDLG